MFDADAIFPSLHHLVEVTTGINGSFSMCRKEGGRTRTHIVKVVSSWMLQLQGHEHVHTNYWVLTPIIMLLETRDANSPQMGIIPQ